MRAPSVLRPHTRNCSKNLFRGPQFGDENYVVPEGELAGGYGWNENDND